MSVVDVSRSHDHRSVVRRAVGVDAWRRTAVSLALLPVSLVTTGAVLGGGGRWAAHAQAGVVRRITGSVPRAARGVGSTSAASLLGIPLGALAWVIAALAGPNTVRAVLLYGLMGDGDYSASWGGPTLAGAWMVHAAIALALVPFELGLIRAIGELHARLLEPDRPTWVMPGALLLGAVGAVFVVALVRQL